MWGAIWEFLKGLGSSGAGSSAGAGASTAASVAPAMAGQSAMAAPVMQAAASPTVGPTVGNAAGLSSSGGGAFSGIGNYLTSDKGRSDIAGQAQQQGQQSANAAGGAAQNSAGQGMQFASNGGAKPPQNGLQSGIGSTYDPNLYQKMMMLGRR